MSAKVEVAVRELATCLQTIKVYGPLHPMFQKSLDRAYLLFKDALADHQEIVIGIVGEELAFQKEILFDLA